MHVIHLLLVIIFAFQARATTSRSKCSGDVCDPDRYAELTSALCGYNVLIGEPYSLISRADPGIRNQIFSPNTEMNDGSGRFFLNGITAYDVSQCSANIEHKVVTTMKQYK